MALKFDASMYQSQTPTKEEAILAPLSQAVQNLPAIFMAKKAEKRKMEQDAFQQDMELFNAQLKALQIAQGETRIDPMTQQPITYAGIKGLEKPGAIERTPTGAFKLNWDVVSPGTKDLSGGESGSATATKTKIPIYFDKSRRKWFGADDPTKEIAAPKDLAGYQVFEMDSDERAAVMRDNQTIRIIDNFNKEAGQYFENMMFTEKGKALLASNNPLADNTIPTMLARSIEKGILSDQDKMPYGGSLAFDTRVKRIITRLGTGKLDAEDRGFINQLFDTMNAASLRNIESIAFRRSNQYADEKIGLSQEYLFDRMFPKGIRANKISSPGVGPGAEPLSSDAASDIKSATERGVIK